MGCGSTDYEALERRLGYTFRDRPLLVRALTHPSYSQQFPDRSNDNNQRLEFLGDSVLGLILSDALFHAFPSKREGILTRNRSALARGPQLASLALEKEIGEFLLLGDGEEANRGRNRESILEDALEAVIGAIYLDSGFPAASKIVLNWYGDLAQRLDGLLDEHNPKGRLQELMQPVHGNSAIVYRVIGENGPDHRKMFEVEVSLMGQAYGSGSGTSKKEAEEEAARNALLKLDKQAFVVGT